MTLSELARREPNRTYASALAAMRDDLDDLTTEGSGELNDGVVQAHRTVHTWPNRRESGSNNLNNAAQSTRKMSRGSGGGAAPRRLETPGSPSGDSYLMYKDQNVSKYSRQEKTKRNKRWKHERNAEKLRPNEPDTRYNYRDKKWSQRGGSEVDREKDATYRRVKAIPVFNHGATVNSKSRTASHPNVNKHGWQKSRKMGRGSFYQMRGLGRAYGTNGRWKRLDANLEAENFGVEAEEYEDFVGSQFFYDDTASGYARPSQGNASRMSQANDEGSRELKLQNMVDEQMAVQGRSGNGVPEDHIYKICKNCGCSSSTHRDHQVYEDGNGDLINFATELGCGCCGQTYTLVDGSEARKSTGMEQGIGLNARNSGVVGDNELNVSEVVKDKNAMKRVKRRERRVSGGSATGGPLGPTITGAQTLGGQKPGMRSPASHITTASSAGKGRGKAYPRIQSVATVSSSTTNSTLTNASSYQKITNGGSSQYLYQRGEPSTTSNASSTSWAMPQTPSYSMPGTPADTPLQSRTNSAVVPPKRKKNAGPGKRK